eukprot:scaffold1730_cov117-Isochrysis_galbana.AAC.4
MLPCVRVDKVDTAVLQCPLSPVARDRIVRRYSSHQIQRIDRISNRLMSGIAEDAREAEIKAAGAHNTS